MIPDRIGIIGSTQGVNVSSRPAPKNTAMTAHKRPDSRTPAKRTSSLTALEERSGEEVNGSFSLKIDERDPLRDARRSSPRFTCGTQHTPKSEQHCEVTTSLGRPAPP